MLGVVYDREAFENHKSQLCEKVSRGKREKWCILCDTFTPVESDDGSNNSDQIESSLVADLGHASPPTSILSPSMLDFKPVAPAGPVVERDYVPIKEHLEL
ncbi:hypothetical protein QBC46DRAFT_410353 [Diplogelasinospora grovesii]|uniref:Uncharacterized protein n=1 Tax=Diplogelasinospora grovesii TaxID=303347 RepID=A0AAN6N5T2_9PEZI|nr:hypothetical protein QBC46DRAFT_410353 [Diplogelasinospora grovesii]